MSAKSRRIACVECRQQKVKCLGNEDEGPCNRCTRRDIPCVIDVEYKRTAKRKRIALLEKEMEQLRKQIADGQRESLSPEASGGASATNDNDTDVSFEKPTKDHLPSGKAIESNTIRPTRRDADQSALPSASFVSVHRLTSKDHTATIVKDWTCDSKSADGISLDSQTIETLFREYVEHYHPIMPVVDVSVGPRQIYNSSPALFWTIMAVASRHSSDTDLTLALSGVQKLCISEIAVSPVSRYASNKDQSSFNLPNVYAVQAFIISSLWPLPTSSISADSAWNTSGIAIFTAIRAGLHMPGFHKEFGRVSSSIPNTHTKQNERLSTWIAANAVGQSVAGMLGYPSVSSFRAAGLKSTDVPVAIYHYSLVQMAEKDIETSLNSNHREAIALAPLSERLSLIRILSTRLDDLEHELGADLNVTSWFDLLAARLHLYLYYFFDSKELPLVQLQKGYVAAYNACLDLLDYVDQASTADESYAKYMPLVHIQILWQAASVVNKLYHSKWSTKLSKRKGKELYFKTAAYVAKASVFEHDLPFRAAEIMQQMWQVFGRLANSHHVRVRSAEVSIRTRMAASIFFDCLWTMRDECEILSHAPTIFQSRAKNEMLRGQRPDTQGRTMTVSSPSGLTGGSFLVNDTVSPRSPFQSTVPLSNMRGQGSANSLAQGPPKGFNVLGMPGGDRLNGREVSLGQKAAELAGFETPPQDCSPDSLPTPETGQAGWDANAAWKDVNIMMEDYGFPLEDMFLQNL